MGEERVSLMFRPALIIGLTILAIFAVAGVGIITNIDPELLRRLLLLYCMGTSIVASVLSFEMFRRFGKETVLGVIGVGALAYAFLSGFLPASTEGLFYIPWAGAWIEYVHILGYIVFIPALLSVLIYSNEVYLTRFPSPIAIVAFATAIGFVFIVGSMGAVISGYAEIMPGDVVWTVSMMSTVEAITLIIIAIIVNALSRSRGDLGTIQLSLHRGLLILAWGVFIHIISEVIESAHEVLHVAVIQTGVPVHILVHSTTVLLEGTGYLMVGLAALTISRISELI